MTLFSKTYLISHAPIANWQVFILKKIYAQLNKWPLLIFDQRVVVSFLVHINICLNKPYKQIYSTLINCLWFWRIRNGTKLKSDWRDPFKAKVHFQMLI